MIKISAMLPKKSECGDKEITTASFLQPLIERAINQHLSGIDMPESINLKIDFKDGQAFVTVS